MSRAERDLITAVEDAKQSLLLAERALLFYRAYRQTGKMTAIHKSGARVDGEPHFIPGNPEQSDLNIAAEAASLARWSMWT